MLVRPELGFQTGGDREAWPFALPAELADELHKMLVQLYFQFDPFRIPRFLRILTNLLPSSLFPSRCKCRIS